MSAMEHCHLKEWNGCCCSCQHHVEIRKHPWNDAEAKGPISARMGWACLVPMEFDSDDHEHQPHGIFFSHGHGMCEMFTPIGKPGSTVF